MTRRRRSSNWELAPLPTAQAIVEAVRELNEEARARAERAGRAGLPYVPQMASAEDVAIRLRVERARRAGRGAVKGSWSGYMAPALRIAPRMRSLAARGELVRSWDSEHRGIYRYQLPRNR